VQYIAANWRDVERMNAKHFATEMTTLVVEDVLNKMKPDALEDRLLFMAATYNIIDEKGWADCVLKQVYGTDFAKHLTHNLLMKLYNIVNENENMIKVLDLIPRTTMLAASQKEIEVQVAAEREVAACDKCDRYVTRWLVKHDPDGCVEYKHPGGLSGSRYACCQISIGDSNCRGCLRVYEPHHTVIQPFRHRDK
jgi:hypothetical protein